MRASHCSFFAKKPRQPCLARQQRRPTRRRFRSGSLNNRSNNLHQRGFLSDSRSNKASNKLVHPLPVEDFRFQQPLRKPLQLPLVPTYLGHKSKSQLRMGLDLERLREAHRQPQLLHFRLAATLHQQPPLIPPSPLPYLVQNQQRRCLAGKQLRLLNRQRLHLV